MPLQPTWVAMLASAWINQLAARLPGAPTGLRVVGRCTSWCRLGRGGSGSTRCHFSRACVHWRRRALWPRKCYAVDLDVRAHSNAACLKIGDFIGSPSCQARSAADNPLDLTRQASGLALRARGQASTLARFASCHQGGIHAGVAKSQPIAGRELSPAFTSK